jgi:membrane protein
VSTNGVNSMLEGFNKSYHGIAVRTGFKQWITALSLTFMIAVIIIFSISSIIITEIAAGYLQSKHLVNAGTQIFLLRTATWLILLTAALLTISCLYYYGPSKKNRRPFISVGSVTATILLALTSVAFNFFVSNISQHNKIYGSIGTLIVILIWINFNTLQLLIGFELNASIENALKNSESRMSRKEEEKPVHRSV